MRPAGRRLYVHLYSHKLQLQKQKKIKTKEKERHTTYQRTQRVECIRCMAHSSKCARAVPRCQPRDEAGHWFVFILLLLCSHAVGERHITGTVCHAVRAVCGKRHETVECPSVRPSVCLSCRSTAAAAAAGGFAAVSR